MVTGRSRGLVRGLVVASHFPPTVMVTAFALALSAGIGAGARTTTLVALAVLTGQLSVGWSNDWLDARRDVAVGRADKPVVTGLVTAATLRAAALVALGACVVLSLATGLLPGVVHVVTVGVAWSYNALLKATWWSWAPYAVSFGLLAVFVVLAAPGEGRPAPWAVAAAALLGVGAHVANTLPDLEDDAATGVRGLPHRLGRRASSILAPVLLAAASALVVLAPPTPPGPVTWALGAVAVALALAAGVVGVVRPRSRAPFALSMAVAGVCVVLLVLAALAVVVPG
ncbi:UbiA family prenyltransferase [Cellulosimicrobium funkei]|uniref:Ubiquinone biosynthesis protein UbiA n=1 Tax=Cellulosimicrobium funkei TaxID=264251 RepID=A0A4Y8R702_9MICO|nr:UbiA family prenyltransferase [Cellulosimicrobium funkei]TFF16656.1 ubiquinone biosynthesis protein UbiA [Cellulosimicrobium funkei]TGA78514.1 ubiquinone biosynthesis protein UbiA [Cellulosimicrobium terreum]